jgi:hypothetical protein
MRPLLFVPALLLLACTPQGAQRIPPKESLYFPTGLVFAPGEAGSPGVVYVASANFDRRYDFGTITAIDLAKLAELPAFGTPVPVDASGKEDPADIFDLRVAAENQVLVQSFTGEMAGYQLPGGPFRLFVPSRSEGNQIHTVDAAGAALNCTFPGASAQDCSTGSPSTTALETTATGKPRAPEPYGITVTREGRVWVTHVRGADSPVGSGKNVEGYVVNFDAANPKIEAENFVLIGQAGGTNSIAVGQRFAFVTGRFASPTGAMIRLVDRTGRVGVLNPGLENVYQVLESRGVGLTSDERRLFIVGRSPDTLLVLDVVNSTADFPSITVVRGVPLPSGGNGLKIVERPGRGPLVLVTSSLANVVSVYDDDLGQLVAQVSNLGSQPFGLDVQPRTGPAGTSGVRVFVSTFGDGRVAVLDMPDVNNPQNIHVVALLGLPQFCILDPASEGCPQ